MGFLGRALLHSEPLSLAFGSPAPSYSAVTRRNLSVIASQCQSSSLCRLRDISLRPEGVFPDRGATGVPVLVLLDELGFSKPETEVLRCLGAQHRYEFSLVERSLDAVCLDSGALFFAQDKTFFVQQGLPDLPMAPLSGELSAKQTERFVTKERSSVEHSPAAVANEGKARLLKSRKATTHRPTRPANGSPFGRAGALAPERVCSGTALFGGAQSSSRCQ